MKRLFLTSQRASALVDYVKRWLILTIQPISWGCARVGADLGGLHDYGAEGFYICGLVLASDAIYHSASDCSFDNDCSCRM